MKSITVKTRDELLKAKNENYDEIILVGAIANNLKKSKKITTLGKGALGVLTATFGAATVIAPTTGGLSYAVLAPVAFLTGLEIVAIIAALSIGIALILAIFKGYEEISYEPNKLVLRKNRSLYL